MSTKKQAFYENHSGGTITEINTITLIILLGHAAYLNCQRAGLLKTRIDQFSWGFVCYFLNILLAITVYSNKHYVLILLYTLLNTGTIYITPRISPKNDSIATDEKKESVERPSEQFLTRASMKNKKTTAVEKKKVPFVSAYRATMMITTILAILAVDLPIFPRRYAKSETWGTSLMDLGVGSFVFSSGVVSSTLKTGIRGGLKQTGILGLMGVARAVMVRGTGYHEHTSEYGQHWNFFITLSLLPPLLPFFRWLKERGMGYLAQGFLIVSGYQFLLVQTAWQSWIISAPRETLISANKEGLSSFAGYTAIFLFGLDIGSLVLSRKSRPVNMLLLISGVSFWSAYLFSTTFFGFRVSRRIANGPYILWVAAHNTTFMFALAMIDEVFKKSAANQKQKSGMFLDRINSRGLYVFLGSNLLTGGINLAMGDAMMTSSTFTGLSIMLAYSLIISTFSFAI